MSSTPLRVRVPASTANLGSGFDALGMALALHDEVVVFPCAEQRSGTARVHVRGEGAGRLPENERHLVVRVLRDTLASLNHPMPGLRLECDNRIPHSRGLGSSAAAIVAGIAAGYALAGRELTDDLPRALHLGASYEGHADNVAASLLGGFVIAWHDGGAHGWYRAVRMDPHPDLSPVAFVPGTESATRTTRGLLPERVPHADAAFSAGRAALAVHGLSRDPSVLLTALDDRLHEEYREPAWPETVRLVRELRRLGVPAAVSGAGPTVVAFPPDGQVPPELAHPGFTARQLPLEYAGVCVEPVAEGAHGAQEATFRPRQQR